MTYLLFTSADVNRLVLSYLSFSDLVRSVILVSKAWNKNYRRGVHSLYYPPSLRPLHGLTIPRNTDRKTAERILSTVDITLKYLKVAGTITLPALSYLECLDLDLNFDDFVFDFENRYLQNLNSVEYPSLRHLILRHPQNVKIKGLTRLRTLTLYIDTFSNSRAYLEGIEGKYNKVVFHGKINSYNFKSDHINSVEIHSPCNKLDFACTSTLKHVAIDINSDMPHNYGWFEMNTGSIEINGDVSYVEELTIIGENVVLPSPQQFKRLRVLRVSPNLVDQFIDKFPFLEIVQTKVTKKTCGECNTQIKHPQTCGRCRRVYYCNRQCQVKHWPTHKVLCKHI